jgi:hypothetical protein
VLYVTITVFYVKSSVVGGDYCCKERRSCSAACSFPLVRLCL